MRQSVRNKVESAAGRVAGLGVEALVTKPELVEMPLGRVLYEVGGTEIHVYFPTSAEIAVVGNEGIVGISQFMGNSTPSRVVVQSAGKSYRLNAQVLKTEIERSGSVTHLSFRRKF